MKLIHEGEMEKKKIIKSLRRHFKLIVNKINGQNNHTMSIISYK